jgi:hypothetical protein
MSVFPMAERPQEIKIRPGDTQVLFAKDLGTRRDLRVSPTLAAPRSSTRTSRRSTSRATLRRKSRRS